MADFLGTRDNNVAISTDNANRKVLILDTITNFDDGVGNIESAEGLFDLGGTDSTSNPTNFNGNIESSGFYTFANTLSLDAIYDVTLGAKVGMSSEDEYDLFDSGRGATLFEDAKAPFDGSPEVQAGAEIQVGSHDTDINAITSFRKIAQQTTIKGRFLQFSVNFEKRTDTGEDIVASASGETVTFNNSFFAIPSISVAGQGMAVGDFFTISSKTKNGFTIQFFNSSNVGISRTFDYQAQGFGLKS